MKLLIALATLGGSLLALAIGIFVISDSFALKVELVMLVVSLIASIALAYQRWRDYTQGQEELLHLKSSMQLVNEHMLQCLNEAHITQESLRTEATHDPLTGLYNRRLLDDNLGREIARASRDNYPLCAVMLDVDNFKQLNDTHGHIAGDLVLKQLATVIAKHCRASDLAFRYGGEEFLILMPNIPESAAIERAERWREECEDSLIVYDQKTLRFTVSFGLAIFPYHAQSATELIESADSAMYAAKKSGRNRVVLFRPAETTIK